MQLCPCANKCQNLQHVLNRSVTQSCRNNLTNNNEQSTKCLKDSNAEKIVAESTMEDWLLVQHKEGLLLTTFENSKHKSLLDAFTKILERRVAFFTLFATYVLTRWYTPRLWKHLITLPQEAGSTRVWLVNIANTLGEEMIGLG